MGAEDGVPVVRLLGPVQFLGSGGRVIDLPSASQRRLLAVLALHAPRSVRSGFLCQVLDITPGALRTSIARLRRNVGDDLLRTAVGGYRLVAEVDAALVCTEIDSALADPDALSIALERWRGPALEEFRDEAWAVGSANRLDEVRASAIEDLAERWLTDGQPEHAIRTLGEHIVEHPLRDRAQGLLMRALACSGRQAEALRVFQSHREYLGAAVGLDPGEELREIEQRIAAGWRGVDETESAHDRDRRSGDARTPVLDDTIRSTATGVGRHSALARLTAAAQRTADEGAGVVVVSGEVGIGKTTLLADFARRVADPRGWDVYYGRCDEFVGAPFQPLERIVGCVVDHLPDDEMHAHAARHGGDLLRLLPNHAARIPAPPATADDRTARHLLFDAVADVVSRAARRGPTVIAIDDLQWAEPTVVHLLRHLVRVVGPHPVLFVPIVRDMADGISDHVREALGDWARGRMDRIVLDGLDRDDLVDLVRVRIPATAERDVAAVADALGVQTAGNPLLADHLLEHWERAGRLVFADAAVRVNSPVDFSVPPSLRDLVWHRISALGDGAAATLTAAATLGIDFQERVLAAMPGIDGSTLPALLDRAVTAGVLADNPSTTHSLRFTHALVAQALVADLHAPARRRLHAEALAALVATGAASTPDLAPRLAHHARLAGQQDDALRWATDAGDAALADLAPDEAIHWYETAIADATALGRSDEVRAGLLVRLGEARSLSGAPDALATIVEGAHLAMETGASAALVRAALAIDRGTITVGQPARLQLDILEAALAASADTDIATRARLTALIAQRLVRTDETDRRNATARDALELARSAADRTMFAEVAAHVLQALWAPGTASFRATLAREAVSAVGDADDPDLVAVVHFAAYCAAVCAGDAASAAALLERLHEVAAELRDPQMRWAIGVLDAFVATMEGSFAEAERIMADTVELGLRIGVEEAIGCFAAQSFALGTFAGRHAELLPVVEQGVESTATATLAFRIGHAIVCCEVGQPEVAVALLHAAMHGEVEPTTDDFVRTTELIGLAVLALELEDIGAAEWLHPQIVPLADEVSFNSVTSQGPIAAYAGKLDSLLGNSDRAERFLLDALATTDAFGWQYHRGTTLLALAENRFRATGRLDAEGMAWLTAAEDLCDRYGMVGWAKRAALLRERCSRRTGIE